MKKRSTLGWLAAVAVIGVLAAVAAVALARRAAQDDTPQAPARIIPVQVAAATRTTLHETVRGIGTLQPRQTVQLMPEISGRISAIHFEEGGAITQGQPLFEIHDAKLRSQLASAEAALNSARARRDNAQLTFTRLSAAHERGGVTGHEIDQARLELQSLEADVARLDAEVQHVQEQLIDTRIMAPFDGVISERRVDVGAYVSSGQHLATVFDVGSLEIAFGVPERHMGRVQPGQRVHAGVSAYRDRRFEGEITFVSPEVRETTRDFLVKAVIPNPQALLKPGASATVVVELESHGDRIVIPEESLVATRTGYMVFVIENERASRRTVQTGLRDRGIVEITEGLQEGEIVVRSGHLRLADGMSVRITE